MKKIFNFFVAVMLSGVMAVNAQFSIPTTPHTRSILRSPDASTTRSIISVVGTVRTIAELRALSGSALTNIVHVLGYYNTNDKGTGLFQWNPNSLGTTNYGDCFCPLAQSTAIVGRWERIIQSNQIDCRWWGVGYGQSDDADRLQALVNKLAYDTTIQERVITFPAASTINLPVPIVLSVTNSNPGFSFLPHLTLQGVNRPINTGGQTKFVLTGTNQVGFIVQYARMVDFENIAVYGRNDYSSQINGDRTKYLTNANYIVSANGIATNANAPHAGIVIDPFNSGIPASNQYSNVWAGYYAIPATGGSSRVHFQNCLFQNLYCGVVVSAGTTVQNAEEITADHCSFEGVANAWCAGQSQTKANSLVDCRWASCQHVINCLDFGNSQGYPPNILNGDLVECYDVIRARTDFGGCTISGLYCEALTAIGTIYGTGNSREVINFQGCRFFLLGGSIPPEYELFTNGKVEFHGCSFNHSSAWPYLFFEPYTGSLSTEPLISFFGGSIVHDGMNIPTVLDMDWLATNADASSLLFPFRRIIFDNLRVSAAPANSQFTPFIRTITLNALNRQEVLPGTTIIVADGTSYRVGAPTFKGNGAGTGATIAYTAGTSTGTITYSTANQNQWKVGDIVYSSANNVWPASSSPVYNSVNMYVGWITNVTSTVATIAGVPVGVPANMGSGASSLQQRWIPRFHQPTTGDLTSGSSVISNVSPDPTGVWIAGDRITSATGLGQGAGFSGIVTATTSSTISFRQTAGVTLTGVALYDAPIYRIVDDNLASTAGGTGFLKASQTAGGTQSWLLDNTVINAAGGANFTSDIYTTKGMYTDFIPITGSAVDLSLGNKFAISLGANTTFTFSNPTQGKEYEFWVENGSYTPTWPTIQWGNGNTAPTVTANKIDKLRLTYLLGSYGGSFVTNYNDFFATFDPTTIANIKSWWDASDITKLYQDSAATVPVVSDGDPIGAVVDKSSNAIKMVQSTSSKRPTYKTAIQNGKSVMRFDGVDDCFTFSANNTVATVTVFAVATSRANTGAVDIYTSNGQGFFLNGGASTFTKRANFVSATLDGNSASNGTFVLLTGINDTATTLRLYSRGAQFTSGAANSSSTTYQAVGGRGSEQLNGDIAELIVYNRALTDAERKQIELYLILKWNIQ